MSMHQSDYFNLGKTILGNVLQNPTILQSIPQVHQTQATAVVGLLYSLFHIFGSQTTPTVEPSVSAPVITETDSTTGYPSN